MDTSFVGTWTCRNLINNPNLATAFEGHRVNVTVPGANAHAAAAALRRRANGARETEPKEP